MNPDDFPFWLSLNRIADLGNRGRVALLEHFGGIRPLFEAPRSELAAVLGNPPASLLDALQTPLDAAALGDELAWLESEDCHLVGLGDPDYPPLLRQIHDPPVLLYVRGDRRALHMPQLAVVGSRNPTPTGRDNARAFARTLAGAGFTITSGLAIGIDGAAHEGALDAGGLTVAVAATGPDRVYPARHRELARRIAGRGAVVSEFPPGTPPLRDHFPRRNRIISGLSCGTLVVEAAIRSGSLITARLAADQGREVFAIPGSIHSPLARGCHALIRDGAKLVETARDVIEEQGIPAQFVLENQSPAGLPAAIAPDSEQARLLAELGHDPVSPATLVERTGLTAGAVSSMLLNMELQGLVAVCPGGTYVRTP